MCSTVIRALVLAAVCSLATQAASAMKFHDASLINGGSLTLPHGVTFPAKIEAAEGLKITATATAATITGNTAVSTNGVATFDSLAFMTCVAQPTAITFTATNTESGEVVATLVSGPVAVKAVANSELLFDATSALNSATSATAVSGKRLDAVKINILDSCGTKDESNTGFAITVSSAEAVVAGEATVTVTNGVAIFSDLSFTSSDVAARLTFTVKTSGVAAVEGKSLVTGMISVHAAATPNFAIRFKKSHSAFVHSGSGASVTLNQPITPAVTVEVVNSAGERDTTTNVRHIIATVDSGAISGAVATVVNGVATFPHLTITEMPNSGVAVFTFTADETAMAELHSGSVTVFAPEGPFFALSSIQFAFGAFALALVLCGALVTAYFRQQSVSAPSHKVADYSTSCQV